MALFIIQSFKTHPLENRPWSNRYIVSAEDLQAARNAAISITAAEVLLHNQATVLTYARVSTLIPGDGSYVTVPTNAGGQRPNPTDNLPLWNTLRVDITVAGGGRPSRKYYRPPLGESDVNNYQIEPTIASLFTTTLNDLIGDLETNGTPLVDPDGQEWLNATTITRVQMRQLHRRRRRRPAP